MDKVAVLIPCYNEATTIGKVINDFRKELPNCNVYVYDNNSTDGTATIADVAGTVVRREYQQGKGNVIRRMFQDIDADCYILVDGDDTYPADVAMEMCNLILNHQADMVVGDRLSSTYYIENKRLFHNFGNSLVRWSINKLFHTDIKDILTGYRAFSYRFVKTFPVLSQGFEIETEMTIHAIDKNLQIDNVIVEYCDRPVGSNSKLNTYSDGLKVIRTVLRLFKNYRPAKFFGCLGLLMFLTQLVFLVPVLIEYKDTGYVERFPTLIVCGFVVMASLLSFFAGQILQTINQKNRQDFEIELLKAMEQYRMKNTNNNSFSGRV